MHQNLEFQISETSFHKTIPFPGLFAHLFVYLKYLISLSWKRKKKWNKPVLTHSPKRRWTYRKNHKQYTH